MKKNYSLFIIYLSILTSLSVITFTLHKHMHRQSTDILLSQIKEFIEKKRTTKIAKLENSKKPEKQAQAEILKKRNRLDHIKIVGNNGVTYLQLENSVLLIPLESRYYYYNLKKAENYLDELKQHSASFDQKIKVVVYPSRKHRMNFLFGSWYTYNDLYSASIKVNFDIKDAKLGHRLPRSNFDQDNKITWENTGNTLKT